MRLIRGCRLVLGVVVSLTLATMGTLTLGVDDASAQCAGSLILLPIASPTCNDASGGNARAAGGDGGNGGLFTTVRDVGNAEADASNLVIVHDITTGDATASDVNVDATDATRPVVVSVAGSFVDTGVDIFAPGGSSQAGTTGGNGITADSSGGPGGDGGSGGDARANGGNGGDVLSLLP
jgi:hypothetical protein